MKKTLKIMLAAVLVGVFASPQVPIVLGAASGNYTDLLPIGVPSDVTVISRGSGWAVTTLPPTQTFGDALSRVQTTVWQSTGPATINATLTVSTMTALAQGNVGSTTFPAAWIATGRSIEIRADGTYATPASTSTWRFDVKLGTTSIFNTTLMTIPSNQPVQMFNARAVITIATTGANGTVLGSYIVFASSGASAVAANVISFSTYTNTTAAVDLTSQLTVNPIFVWGAATSSMTINNLSVRFLN